MIGPRPRQALSRLLVEWVRGLNSPGLQASTVQTLRRGMGGRGWQVGGARHLPGQPRTCLALGLCVCQSADDIITHCAIKAEIPASSKAICLSILFLGYFQS